MKSPIRTARAFPPRTLYLILAPLLFLGLVFVQNFVFLRDIRGALLLVSGVGVVVMLAVFAGERKREAIERYLEAIPVRRLARRLFLVSFLVYLIYATGLVFPALPFTGDEPHYLLITRSIVKEGDINLAEDYQNKEYQAFYDGELNLHAYPGKKGERFLYSRHLPALSVLVAPFYVAGEKAGGWFASLTSGAGIRRTVLVFSSRFPICLLTALLGQVFFLTACQLTGNKRAALAAWLVLSFTMPLFFYSQLIYPEVPVALILALVAYALILKTKLSWRNLFLAGTGVGLLPWFGIKYIPLAGAAALVVILMAAKAGRMTVKNAASFLAPLAVSSGLFFLFLKRLYGGVAPQAVYRGAAEGADLSISRFLADGPVDFLSRLLAHLVDQRIGLFVYAPVLILSLAGFLLLRKGKRGPAHILGGLFVVFWVFCSLTRYWAGFCPPGRPLLPVIWIPALFLASALAIERSKPALAIRKGLVIVSLFFVFAALPNPRILYQDSISALLGSGHPELPSQFLGSLNGLLFDWTKGIPMLATTVPEQRTWGIAVLWILGIFLITGISLWRKKSVGQEHVRLGLTGHLGLVVILGLAFVTLTFFSVRLDDGFAVGSGEAFPQDQNCLGPELGGFWVKGESQTGVIVSTDRPLSELSVILRSPVKGKTTVRLGSHKKEWRRPLQNMAERTLVYSAPRAFRWNGKFLHTLLVKEKSGFYPYKIDIDSRDRRFLGVFVRLEF